MSTLLTLNKYLTLEVSLTLFIKSFNIKWKGKSMYIWIFITDCTEFNWLSIPLKVFLKILVSPISILNHVWLMYLFDFCFEKNWKVRHDFFYTLARNYLQSNKPEISMNHKKSKIQVQHWNHVRGNFANIFQFLLPQMQKGIYWWHLGIVSSE